MTTQITSIFKVHALQERAARQATKRAFAEKDHMGITITPMYTRLIKGEIECSTCCRLITASKAFERTCTICVTQWTRAAKAQNILIGLGMPAGEVDLVDRPSKEDIPPDMVYAERDPIGWAANADGVVVWNEQAWHTEMADMHRDFHREPCSVGNVDLVDSADEEGLPVELLHVAKEHVEVYTLARDMRLTYGLDAVKIRAELARMNVTRAVRGTELLPIVDERTIQRWCARVDGGTASVFAHVEQMYHEGKKAPAMIVALLSLRDQQIADGDVPLKMPTLRTIYRWVERIERDNRLATEYIVAPATEYVLAPENEEDRLLAGVSLQAA